MKKSFYIIFGLIAIAFLTISLTDYDYTQVSVGSYTYLTDIANFPTDVKNNSLPISSAGSNFDNEPYSRGFVNPSNPTDTTNKTTDAGATLGRVIFYDKWLSVNKSIACADCHKQQYSFTDNLPKSYGWRGPLSPVRTFRNSMNLNHIRFHKVIKMYWDLRASSIENQVSRPMFDGAEMGMSLDTTNPDGVGEIPRTESWANIVARINQRPFYQGLFNSAFGTVPGANKVGGNVVIDSQTVVMALAQFVRTINTFDSRFRKALDLTTIGGSPESAKMIGLNSQQLLGRDLFMDITRGNCQSCHTRFLFVNQGAKNQGVDGSIGYNTKWTYTSWATRNDYNTKDSGLGGFRALGTLRVYPTTNWQQDTGKVLANMGRMAVPSLINVALTGPYMHDGRYKTLEQVVNFYSDSIKNNTYNTLSSFLREYPRFIGGQPVPGWPNNITDPSIVGVSVDTSHVRHLAFTPVEKRALVEFMKTFTDTTTTKDPRWGNPFVPIAGTQKMNFQRIEPTLALSTTNYSNNTVVFSSVNGESYEGTIKLVNDKGEVLVTKKTKFKLGESKILFVNVKHGRKKIIIEKDGKEIKSIEFEA